MFDSVNPLGREAKEGKSFEKKGLAKLIKGLGDVQLHTQGAASNFRMKLLK